MVVIHASLHPKYLPRYKTTAKQNLNSDHNTWKASNMCSDARYCTLLTVQFLPEHIATMLLYYIYIIYYPWFVGTFMEIQNQQSANQSIKAATKNQIMCPLPRFATAVQPVPSRYTAYALQTCSSIINPKQTHIKQYYTSTCPHLF